MNDSRSEGRLVAFDPVRHLGYDSASLWNESYPNRADRHAAQAAIINEALQAPISTTGLYAQFVSGRGDGMRIIRQLVAKASGATYFAFPISDPEAIALVGEGQHFEPLFAMSPDIICQCLPLRAAIRQTLPPLNELVLQLRIHGAQP